MKPSKLFFQVSAIVAVLSAGFFISTPQAHADDHKHHEGVKALTTPLGLGGYSPVSYFNKMGPHYGTPAIQAEHQGVVYFFATEDERKQFAADPKKYTPAYGGWCATGMALGKYFPVDVTSYKVVDGRLLLFLNSKEANALELWNQGEEAEQLAKADTFWKTENKRMMGKNRP